MNTQHLGYLGGGVLVAIVVLTLIGVPPEVWLAAALIAGLIGVIALLVVRVAQADGIDVAHRFMAREADATAAPVSGPATTDPAPEVEMVLVREADEASATPAVWLHRRGGRRVHRFKDGGGWTVQRVSTKDPDNPRKRLIGEGLTFASEADAVAAANDLAQGLAPTADTPTRLDTRLVAEAHA